MEVGRGFPDFTEPPVVETVLGIEFEPLPGWDVPQFGLFWNLIKDAYPSSEMMPALPSTIEKFGKDALGQQLPTIEFLQAPPVRFWFRSADKAFLLQVQKDRFVHNWQKTGSTAPYPRYPETLRRFRETWEVWMRFLGEQGIPRPTIAQCEVTYVNHIERGHGWDTLKDLAKVTPLWRGEGSTHFLADPEVVVLNSRYVLPDQVGRLHVLFQPAIRNADQAEIIQLQLTARGQPRGSQTSDIMTWLDLGREWVVRGFTDITTPEMHALWKRTV